MRISKAGNKSGFILLRTLIALTALTVCLAALFAAAAGLIKRNALLRQKVDTEILYRNNAGFSLMESVVAIALLVVFCGLSGAALFTVWRGSVKSGAVGKEAFTRLRTDDRIRRTVFDIPLAFWEGEKDIYEKALAALGTGTSFELFYDREGAARGLKVFYTVGKNEYECKAPFGTMLTGGTR
jgi:hypothetical protein